MSGQISASRPNHLRILLAPGLVTNSVDDDNYAPKGDLAGKVEFELFSRTASANRHVRILLFDTRLYTGDVANLCTTNPVTSPDGETMDRIHIQGIVNFGVDNSGYILLPDQCFALDLHWHSGLQEGNFTPSGDVEIRSGTPSSFVIESMKGSKMHKDELEEYGMQLVSWYL